MIIFQDIVFIFEILIDSSHFEVRKTINIKYKIFYFDISFETCLIFQCKYVIDGILFQI